MKPLQDLVKEARHRGVSVLRLMASSDVPDVAERIRTFARDAFDIEIPADDAARFVEAVAPIAREVADAVLAPKPPEQAP